LGSIALLPWADDKQQFQNFLALFVTIRQMNQIARGDLFAVLIQIVTKNTFRFSKVIFHDIKENIVNDFLSDESVVVQKRCILLLSNLINIIYDSESELESLVDRVRQQIQNSETRFSGGLPAAAIIKTVRISVGIREKKSNDRNKNV
jgi:hypothetical protein